MTFRRKPWSDEERMRARERDRERKKRNLLTPSQLARVNFLEKTNKKKLRKNMSETEKERVKEKDRMRKISDKKLKKLNLEKIKEICRINTLLRVRKLRSQLSEKEKQVVRDKAREGMALKREKGFLGKYKQRKKRDPNYLNIWRNFFRHINLDLFIMGTPQLTRRSILGSDGMTKYDFSLTNLVLSEHSLFK